MLIGGADPGSGRGAIAKNTAQLDVVAFQSFCQCVEVSQAFFVGQSGQGWVEGALIDHILLINREGRVIAERLGMGQHFCQGIQPLFHALKIGGIDDHTVAGSFATIESDKIQRDQVFIGVERNRRISETHQVAVFFMIRNQGLQSPFYSGLAQFL